VENSEMT